MSISLLENKRFAAIVFAAVMAPTSAFADVEHTAALMSVAAESVPVTRVMELEAYDTMRFSRTSIRVEPGESIRFVVSNKGNIRHEFTIGSAAEQAEHAEMMRTKDHAGHMQDRRGRTLDLAPGETKELTVVFSRPGLIQVACNYPGHFQAGMKIRVQVG